MTYKKITKKYYRKILQKKNDIKKSNIKKHTT